MQDGACVGSAGVQVAEASVALLRERSERPSLGNRVRDGSGRVRGPQLRSLRLPHRQQVRRHAATRRGWGTLVLAILTLA